MVPWRAGAAGGLRGVWQRYESALARRPLATQVATSTALWTLGDVLSQRLDRANRAAAGKPAISGRHVAASAAYGATIVGPIGHAWYRWLDAFTSARFARGTLAFVAAKVLLDELVFGPVHVAGYFGAVTLAEGGSLADARAKIAADFWSAYAAELAFWPAFQSLNFSVVPVRHQLLAVNGACLLDATFLCWVSATDDWVGGVKAAVGWGGEGKKKG